MSKFLIVLLCAGLEPGFAATRLLRTPTVSATAIAFAYANNIWIVGREGGTARRLTSFQGQTTNPHFSPDGKWLAFSGEYAGNTDVYVVPAEGGEPKRLTWHPGADVAQGWTSDGKSVLFTSTRATWAPSGAPRFWTVPAQGGVEEPLPLPRGYQGKISRGRDAHRVPHEQLLGRRAPQLSRRAEPPDLDRRSQELRPGVAAVERLEGHGPGVGGGDGLLHLGPRRRGQRLVVRHASEEAGRGDALHRFRREDARFGRRRGGVRAGRLRPRARSEDRAGATSSTSPRRATSRG